MAYPKIILLFFAFLRLIKSDDRAYVSLETSLNPCEPEANDCFFTPSLLKAFEYSFNSIQNVTLEILDSETTVTRDSLELFTQETRPSPVVFQSSVFSQRKRILIKGSSDFFNGDSAQGLSLTKIKLEDAFFSIIVSNMDLIIQNIEILFFASGPATEQQEFLLFTEKNDEGSSSLIFKNFIVDFRDEATLSENGKFPINVFLKVSSLNFIVFFQNSTIKASNQLTLDFFLFVEERENRANDKKAVVIENTNFIAIKNFLDMNFKVSDSFFEISTSSFSGEKVPFHFEASRTLVLFRDFNMFFQASSLNEILKATSSKIIINNFTIGGEEIAWTFAITAKYITNFVENCEVFIKNFKLFNVYLEQVNKF